ncbi:hypothetical protein ACIBCN_06785 [Nocardia sp. NPDC051052]|uniref:hypothetical protein n=1 Tax=Nocardia sp. NPDC051052 TaxID=3364322 RepID=UPI0037A335F8
MTTSPASPTAAGSGANATAAFRASVTRRGPAHAERTTAQSRRPRRIVYPHH